MSTLVVSRAAAPPAPVAGPIIAALVGVALVSVLITGFELHPVLAFVVSALVVTGVAGPPGATAVARGVLGVGDTVAAS